jgi:hypothetical protein
VSILDEDNPLSLVNLTRSSKIFDKIREIQHGEHADIFDFPERELKKELLRRFSYRPSVEENRLRLSFWTEYDNALRESRQILLDRVWGPVMPQPAFYYLMRNISPLAWMFCPPSNFDQFLDEAVQFGLNRLRDYLDIDPVDPVTGRLNLKLMELQAKIVTQLELRKHGGITQRIEQKTQNLHAHIGRKGDDIDSLPLEEIEKRIALLEKKEISPLPGVYRPNGSIYHSLSGKPAAEAPVPLPLKTPEVLPPEENA